MKNPDRPQLVTRPRLASFLMENGCVYEIISNPFNHDGKHPTAWLFTGGNISELMRIWKRNNEIDSESEENNK